MNEDLRLKIISIIKNSGEGHIPSSFSIVDIIDYLYGNVLKIYKNPSHENRDYFILSKGHGCAALYTVLNKHGFLTNTQLKSYSNKNSILGGHPDSTKIPHVEASTGSLGHGFPMACGIALGLKIKKKRNKVITLLGDGECHEGTIWESANIASNRNLTNLIAIIDWNKSAQQLMPIENLKNKWISFGWEVHVINGHCKKNFNYMSKVIKKKKNTKPVVFLAQTIKGKGVSFLEGHGKWHHKIPNDKELEEIKKELNMI
tara:strand:- start:639 stop:1415 length:777 start_codon:yes stop_codon:yes gene_type:complete